MSIHQNARLTPFWNWIHRCTATLTISAELSNMSCVYKILGN